MALDGMFIHLLALELKEKLTGSRVEKIYQPTNEEIVILLRNKDGNHRLLISARANSSRAHLTEFSVDNPKEPPMFCMLMRKWLGGAQLADITQSGFDRILYFKFNSTNELGDPVQITIAAELMGRRSNIILLGNENKIIDSVKRIGIDLSSVRQILPGKEYQEPPKQEKIPVTSGGKQIVDAMVSSVRDIDAAKLLGETLEGASPLICRELVFRSCMGQTPVKSELTEKMLSNLVDQLYDLKDIVVNGKAEPSMLMDETGAPKEFYYLNISQYKSLATTNEYASLSALLDSFYGRRDESERTKQRAGDMIRHVKSKIERIERKLAAQREELLECAGRESFRILGDILSSNAYLIEKGMKEITLTNFFDENGGEVTIELDIMLTPAQNIQRYYKKYKKAATAEKMLLNLINDGEAEAEYLDAVLDSINRSKNETEINAVREELASGGYLRDNRKKSEKKQKSNKLKPLAYRSTDGFLIISGRNNVQNDLLTLKDSKKDDMWFHVQKIAGSHTVIVCEGKTPPARTMNEAAIIAATNSKAKNSRKIPVDYTVIKNVKKIPGSKPGMVTYENFSTAIIDPDIQMVEALSID